MQQLVGSDKENHTADDVSGSLMPTASLCIAAANVSDPSPLLVPSPSSSQSATASADASLRYAPVIGSRGLSTGAVGVGGLASITTRFVLACACAHPIDEAVGIVFWRCPSVCVCV